jgi:hypothetical protein
MKGKGELEAGGNVSDEAFRVWTQAEGKYGAFSAASIPMNNRSYSMPGSHLPLKNHGRLSGAELASAVPNEADVNIFMDSTI